MSKELQAETEAQQGTNADVTSVSHTCTKPNVGCSTILLNSNFKKYKFFSNEYIIFWSVFGQVLGFLVGLLLTHLGIHF